MIKIKQKIKVKYDDQIENEDKIILICISDMKIKIIYYSKE